MKKFLWLLTGAGIGMAAYAFLNDSQASLSAADKIAAWDTGERVFSAVTT